MTAWSGVFYEPPPEGSGTVAMPYLIRNGFMYAMDGTLIGKAPNEHLTGQSGVEFPQTTKRNIPQTVNNYYLTTANSPSQGQPVTPTGEDDGLIFGMSPLLLIGIAAGGLWLLSSMSEGKK